MFDTGGMSDELKAMKVDVTRLLSAAGEQMFDTSTARTEALADQITAALAELGEKQVRSESNSMASSRSVRWRRWLQPSHSAWPSASC